MPGQSDEVDKGGTLRLGAYPCVDHAGHDAWRGATARIISTSVTATATNSTTISGTSCKMPDCTFSGTSPDGRLVETVELTDRPFHVGVQYHPEFKSRPNKPHPLFLGFIKASLGE